MCVIETRCVLFEAKIIILKIIKVHMKFTLQNFLTKICYLCFLCGLICRIHCLFVCRYTPARKLGLHVNHKKLWITFQESMEVLFIQRSWWRRRCLWVCNLHSLSFIPLRYILFRYSITLSHKTISMKYGHEYIIRKAYTSTGWNCRSCILVNILLHYCFIFLYNINWSTAKTLRI
jgi:hypothetical protein